MLLTACRGGDGFIVEGDGIVREGWVPGGDDGISSCSAGGDVQVADVVVYRQRGDGGAVVPHEIVLGPALSVAFEGEEGVVGDDGSVERADAAGGYLSSEIVKRLERRVGPIGMRVVGVGTAGERRVSAADEAECAAQASVG